MALLLVLLCTILAFSLASTQQCVSSPDSSIDLTLHSHKNASGDWIITVETRRLTIEEDARDMSVDVHHETKICGTKNIEQLIAVALVYPSLHDTSMPGAIEPSTTTTAATLSTATATLSTATATPSTATITTSTTTPKSCPPGYQLYPEFNCYKAFPSYYEMKTWSEARDQCMRDGGDLMVMETDRERQNVFIPLYKSVKSSSFFPWVGVYKPEGEDRWMTVNGEPVLSTLWNPGQPEKDDGYKCTLAYTTGRLRNFICIVPMSFICEVSL